MTKEERKEILKKYRLSRKLRFIKRDKDLGNYKRDFYHGVRYNVFVRNSQIYQRGYECIIMKKGGNKIAMRYEEADLQGVNNVLVAWLSGDHIHARSVDARIDYFWDEDY